jgi:hypothetical protein
MQKLKLSLILGIIVLGMAIAGYFTAVPGMENREGDFPKIEISPGFFDFGEIRYGDVVSYGFKVKNSGQETLEIRRVATSCACTTARISQDKLEPGEEAELLVSYDSAAMALHGSGREERIIYVRSNDSANPQVEVRIYATVK